MKNIQDFEPEGNDPIRSMLGTLPKQQMPEYLRTNLRVIASRERTYAAAHRTIATTLRTWAANFSLLYQNLMRPLALPFAGGLTSALVMFGLLYPTLVSGYRPQFDSPGIIYEEAQVKELWPFGLAGASKLDSATLVVDVTIDEQGRMIGYSVPTEGMQLMKDSVLRRSIENNLLVTKFKPANFFGAPTQGKLRITIQHSRMDVKG